MKHIIPLLFFTLFYFNTSAQIVKITGYVIDDDTEEALPFCSVFQLGTSNGTATDIDGNFVIEIDLAQGDTLSTSSLGYEDGIKIIDKTLTEQVINFRMKSSAMDAGVEVVVLAGENPANEIMRQIYKHKKFNDLDKVAEYYKAEMYTKTELDLVNITSKMKDMKIFKDLQFVFENIDSVSDVKPFLPAYIAETMSDIHYLQGSGRKEMLTAQRVSGVKNQTVVDFIGNMNEEYNIYDNTMIILGKEFISPFSNAGLTFYEYYIMDSTKIKGKWSYKLKFKPKDKTGNTFYGDFWVSMDDYALLLVNMRMNPEANINLVSRIIIYQEYDPYSEKYWIPIKQKTVIDFSTNKQDKGLGIIGRKTTSFKNFEIDQPDGKEVYTKTDPEDVKYHELERPDSFWVDNRHELLSKNESGVYEMVDSIQNVPVFKTVSEIVEIIVSGYAEWGPVKFGPYSNLINWNDVEGFRMSLGVGTSNNLSKKFQIYGYAGYGFKDKQWKYGGDMQYVFNRYRRSAIGCAFFNDITFENRSTEERKTQSLFAGWLRRYIPQKLMYVQEGKIWFQHTWKKGFSNRIAVMHRRLNPVGHEYAELGGFNFKYLDYNAFKAGYDTISQVNATELLLKARYAYKEQLISGPFKDMSLGSKYPIVELTYILGVKGILGSQFNYHKLRLGIKHWFYTSPVGWIEYEFEIGKVFGTLPYLLLETHPGNEAYFYNKTSFNSMNSFEFVSDFFMHFRLEHHEDGFLLNRIPFIRKYLKWRLVTAIRASWGTLSPENWNVNKLNHYDRNIKHSKDRQRPFSEGPFYGTFDKGPYAEVSIGIENIFQFIRVDALWRVTYLDNRDAQMFSVRVTLNFTF